jgi:hypothetical protein
VAYPSEIKSFTFKRNNIDKVVADDVNVLYTEVTAIEQQLGGVGSGGIGVTTSTWGTGTFSTSVANWFVNDGLAARLKNIEAGLYATLVTGSASAAKLTTPISVNGTTGVDWSSSSYTFTAAAGTLTGTTLNSTVTASSLTSVGTLTNLVVTGSSGTSAPIKLSSGTNIGTLAAGAIEYDGNVFTFIPNTSTGRAITPSSYYYTYYGNSGALGGITSPYGFKRLTLAANTAYEYEGMYVFSFNDAADVSPVSSYPIFKIQGTATIANSNIDVVFWCSTLGSLTATSARSISEVVTVGNTNINLENTTANTSLRVGVVKWKGILRNQQASTGTVFATILGSAAGSQTILKDGSFIKLTPIGIDTVATVGVWT